MLASRIRRVYVATAGKGVRVPVGPVRVFGRIGYLGDRLSRRPIQEDKGRNIPDYARRYQYDNYIGVRASRENMAVFAVCVIQLLLDRVR